MEMPFKPSLQRNVSTGATGSTNDAALNLSNDDLSPSNSNNPIGTAVSPPSQALSRDPNEGYYHDFLRFSEGNIARRDLDGSGTYNATEEIQHIQRVFQEAGEINPYSDEDITKAFTTLDRNQDGEVDRLELAAETILADSPDAWALLDAYGGDARFVPPEMFARLDGVVTPDDSIAMLGLQENTHGQLLDHILDEQNPGTGLRAAEGTYQSPVPVANSLFGMPQLQQVTQPQTTQRNLVEQVFGLMQEMFKLLSP